MHTSDPVADQKAAGILPGAHSKHRHVGTPSRRRPDDHLVDESYLKSSRPVSIVAMAMSIRNKRHQHPSMALAGEELRDHGSVAHYIGFEDLICRQQPCTNRATINRIHLKILIARCVETLAGRLPNGTRAALYYSINSIENLLCIC